MTDFKAGDKVVVRDDIAADRPWWTSGKVYTVSPHGDVFDDDGSAWGLSGHARLFAPAPDADGWYPMPKLKAGDPIPEWMVDPETRYRENNSDLDFGGRSVYVSLGRFLEGAITHYRPAPKVETATTADGKEYRITHNPDGSVRAEVV